MSRVERRDSFVPPVNLCRLDAGLSLPELILPKSRYIFNFNLEYIGRVCGLPKAAYIFENPIWLPNIFYGL